VCLNPEITQRIRRPLLAWFRREKRDLPWRRTCAPYSVWLSEIMLQQTRVEQGTPYYERFLDAFPTVEALAQATEDEVLKLWEGLGYYTRARNLHKAARLIVHKQDGVFPRRAAEWIQLPGVGRYTAGAIASIAFGERVAVLDGNVKRVLSRLFDIEDCVDETRTQDRLWSIAEALVPRGAPGDFNQGMMELGARICLPRNPHCSSCPLGKVCAARVSGTQDQRPVRRPKKETPHQEIVVAAICKNGWYLLGKRPAKGLLAGLWEFPGTTIKPGENHLQALRRMGKEDLGLGLRAGQLFGTVTHAYSHLRVTLHVYACRQESGTPQPKAHDVLKWVPRSRLSQYALPKANHKFLHLLVKDND